jgi:acetyl esterase/lipase
MVHGGAWKIGDKRHSPVVTNKVKYFGERGYTIVSINYDLFPKITVEQQVKEVAKALQYTQENAPKWGADGSKVVLMGHSAGAHLVSLLSTNSLLNSSKYAILGTVSLDSAAYNIPIIMQKSKHYGFYDEVFGNNPEYWKKMSPYYQINNKVKPMYLVCSTLREDSCDQADNFSLKAQSLGSTIYVDKEAKKHEEINEQLGSDLIYTQKIENFINSLN